MEGLFPADFYKHILTRFYTASSPRNFKRWIMSIELVHIGFGNILAMSRTIAIASPNSAPTKRIIHDGRSNGKVIDMTSGRRTKAVIFTDSGHIVLAALAPETIASRFTSGRSGKIDSLEGSENIDEE
jgi:regulator of extracellular matrix RemA (YlzA/DUF370 family)